MLEGPKSIRSESKGWHLNVRLSGKASASNRAVLRVLLWQGELLGHLGLLLLRAVPRVDEELLLQRLNGVGVGDEHLRLALVLNPAVAAAVETVWKVKGKLVAKAEGEELFSNLKISNFKLSFLFWQTLNSMIPRFILGLRLTRKRVSPGRSTPPAASSCSP